MKAEFFEHVHEQKDENGKALAPKKIVMFRLDREDGNIVAVPATDAHRKRFAAEWNAFAPAKKEEAAAEAPVVEQPKKKGKKKGAVA